MCEAISATTMAWITAAGTAASAVMSHQAAENQADAHDAQNQRTANILKQNESLEQMDLARQRQQEFEAAAAEANAYAAGARKDLGALDAIMGEGFAGNSGSRQLATVGIKHGQDMATLASNASKIQSELGFASSATSNARNQQLASLRDADRPSAFGTFLTIAGAAQKAHAVGYEGRVDMRTRKLWSEINTGPRDPNAKQSAPTYGEVTRYVRDRTF